MGCAVFLWANPDDHISIIHRAEMPLLFPFTCLMANSVAGLGALFFSIPMCAPPAQRPFPLPLPQLSAPFRALACAQVRRLRLRPRRPAELVRAPDCLWVLLIAQVRAALVPLNYLCCS